MWSNFKEGLLRNYDRTLKNFSVLFRNKREIKDR